MSDEPTDSPTAGLTAGPQAGATADLTDGPTAAAPAAATRSLRADALRFLRGFGLVAAAWSTILAAAAPTVERRAVLWGGISVLWAWALASQVVRDVRVWWVGWLIAGVAAQLLGPAAGTDGWAVAGGTAFVSLAGAALGQQRVPAIVAVVVLSAAALARGLFSDLHTVASSTGTVIAFTFGALALYWLVRTVQAGEEERERLRRAIVDSEKARAVAQERAESAARLHDSVLQSLAAITRAEGIGEARRHARRAAGELRQWLRDRRTTPGSFRRALERACMHVPDPERVSVGGAGDREAEPDRDRLLLDAVTEAVRNAVVHTSGPVRVYAEVAAGRTTVWVSDRGDGFALENVPDDRLGVRESIVRRLERAGGKARLRSNGEGSEWALTLPARSGKFHTE